MDTKDRYESFEALASSETEGVDYRIEIQDRGSDIAILAIHGGFIESGTSAIARAFSGTEFSYYSFEGLTRDRAHHELHITATHFDEPGCLQLLENVEMVISIHGREDGADPETIWVGGLDIVLREKISKMLQAAGFKTSDGAAGSRGESPENICNKGKSGKGVQLEVPKTLRNGLMTCTRIADYWKKYKDGITD